MLSATVYNGQNASHIIVMNKSCSKHEIKMKIYQEQRLQEYSFANDIMLHTTKFQVTKTIKYVLQ